jgi:dihydrofolate reductase
LLYQEAEMKNKVFIATSLDGYIADRNNQIDWLEMIPNPEGVEMGYIALTNSIDALIMGRNTFEKVCSFDCDWPYEKKVFVLSNTLNKVPEKCGNNVEVIQGAIPEILEKVRAQGYKNLYIDGGKLIQSFLEKDLIDELIITKIPILLGGGAPLFGKLPKHLEFKHVKTEVFLNEIVQSHYIRK